MFIVHEGKQIKTFFMMKNVHLPNWHYFIRHFACDQKLLIAKMQTKNFFSFHEVFFLNFSLNIKEVNICLSDTCKKVIRFCPFLTSSQHNSGFFPFKHLNEFGKKPFITLSVTRKLWNANHRKNKKNSRLIKVKLINILLPFKKTRDSMKLPFWFIFNTYTTNEKLQLNDIQKMTSIDLT